MCLPHKAAPHGVLVEVLCGLFPFPPIEMVLAQPPARLRRGKRGRVLLHHVPKDGGLRMAYSLWRFPPLTRRTMSRDGGGACPDTLGCPMGGWGRTDTRNLKPRLTQPLPRLLLLLECVPMRRDALDRRHPRRVGVGMIGGVEKDFILYHRFNRCLRPSAHTGRMTFILCLVGDHGILLLHEHPLVFEHRVHIQRVHSVRDTSWCPIRQPLV